MGSDDTFSLSIVVPKISVTANTGGVTVSVTPLGKPLASGFFFLILGWTFSYFILQGLVKILDREGWDCRISKASLKLIFDTEKQEQKLINDTYNKQVKEYDQQVKEYNKNNIHSYEGIIIQNF